MRWNYHSYAVIMSLSFFAFYFIITETLINKKPLSVLSCVIDLLLSSMFGYALAYALKTIKSRRQP